MNKFIFNFIFLSLATISSMVCASDISREKRMADQIVDAIFDGEPEFITDNLKHSFLAIHMNSVTDDIKGGAIIMHGRGMHPDWNDVVKPLRTQLPLSGWNTLSIQMPVLDKAAKYYDYKKIFSEATPRIEAAIQFMKSRGNEKIVLIAHSCSIHMSMEWLRNKSTDADISAYIGIGMGATDYKQPMQQDFPLQQLKFPLLDIFGSEDYPAVKAGAAKRLKLIKQAGNPLSRQIIVTDSDHYHKANNEKLVKEINTWLELINS